jgi:hypothetical protein
MTATIGYESILLWGTTIDSMAVLPNVRDLNVALSCDAKDMTPNAAGGWRTSTHGLRDAEITFSLIWDNTDAGLQAIRDAYLNDSTIVLWVAGSIAAACVVTDFSRDERITDAIAVRVTAKPTLSDLDPGWLEDLIDGDVGGFVVDDITGDNVKVAA